MLNIANLEKKGFLVDEKFCVLPGILPYYISSLLGYSQYGMYLNGVVVDFEKGGYGVINVKMKDNAVVLTMDMESEILPESVIVTKTSINLLNVLIAIMILVVIILAVIIILLSFKNKKSAKKQESLKTEKYVSEDAVFEELVDEAGIDYDDEEADDEEYDEVEPDDESEETEEDAEEDK